MEVRVFIVSLACLACLVPPALGKGLVAKAKAIGAVKGAVIGGVKGAVIGAGLGLAAKGAAALVAKKGLLGVLLKGAALKGAALLAKKKAVIKGAGVLALKGLKAAANGMSAALESRSDCQSANRRSPLREIISGATRVAQVALRPTQVAPQKTRSVYRIVSVAPTRRIVAVPV